MGNACDELKELAGAITGDCGKGGVGQAINKFVLNK
jgi:hydroxymethylpyrimidine pyrophosphatase-like HAD family hydrolase